VGDKVSAALNDGGTMVVPSAHTELPGLVLAHSVSIPTQIP
jgi:hypothetical protein